MDFVLGETLIAGAGSPSGTAAFGHIVRTTIRVAPGDTWSSLSGVFATQPLTETPEPSTVLLVLVGVTIAGFSRMKFGRFAFKLTPNRTSHQDFVA